MGGAQKIRTQTPKYDHLFSNHQGKTTQIYQILYHGSNNMVCVNVRRPIRRHCEYNFCNGEHQCILIKNKKKLVMPKPSEFMLLALANTTQKRMSVENIKPLGLGITSFFLFFIKIH